MTDTKRNEQIKKITLGEVYAVCVARCLRSLRRYLGYHQRDLAEHTGMGQPNWSKIERYGILTTQQLHGACDCMGTTPNDIATQAQTLYDAILEEALNRTDGELPETFPWSKKNIASWCDDTLKTWYENEDI